MGDLRDKIVLPYVAYDLAGHAYAETSGTILIAVAALDTEHTFLTIAREKFRSCTEKRPRQDSNRTRPIELAKEAERSARVSETARALFVSKHRGSPLSDERLAGECFAAAHAFEQEAERRKQ